MFINPSYQPAAPWPTPASTRWVKTPAQGVALLIATTLLARLVWGGALGLGSDESYMVAAGRTWQFGYFDHPPLAWWMAWGASHLAGSEAALVVRLPFILLFGLTTWLMFRATAVMFGACAGLWAACLFNAAPVFGVTSSSWVLPDGPMLCALMGALLCLVRALPSQGRASWGWWLGSGACLGLALFSKYSAIFPALGAACFLATAPASRVWLRRPQPYAAALLALAVFAPVLAWNAQHGFVSLLFQAGRAGRAHFFPLGPVVSFAGEALFILPWIWLPLMMAGLFAWRRGRRADPRGWLLLCLAAPAILAFALISLRTRILFHWAAPGYVMLFPLLGAEIARRRASSRAVRLWLAGTAMMVPLGVAVVASEVQWNWLPEVGENFALGTDPDVDAIDWFFLKDALAARAIRPRPGLVMAGTRWHDAGKIDYALGGAMKVICLGIDAREYGLVGRPADYAGDDVVIVAPRLTPAMMNAVFGPMFDSIEVLEPAMLTHAGRPAMLMPLFLGHHLHRPEV